MTEISKTDDPTETVQGYVMDVACVRKSPQRELVERSQAHTRDCALMGHCAESGFALISETGQIALLDDHATLMIVDIVRQSRNDHGIKVQVTRNKQGEKMETSRVEEIS